MLNRTIYYDERHWLRNQVRVLNDEEKALRQYGLKHVYPEELFYRTHKITQKDFLAKLQQSSEPDACIRALFDDDAQSGRRGVLSMSDFLKRREKRDKNKERLHSFVRKFANEGMSTQEIKQTGFMRHSMLY